MSDFDSLKTEFKRYFEALGYGPEDFHSNGDAQWVYAVVDRKASKADPVKSGFHYELICRAGEFYLELHFEFYKNLFFLIISSICPISSRVTRLSIILPLPSTKE